MSEFKMFWIGEHSEVIAARNLKEAADYIGENSDDPDFEGGEVDYIRLGKDSNGDTISLAQAFDKFLKGNPDRPDFVWTAYGD